MVTEGLSLSSIQLLIVDPDRGEALRVSTAAKGVIECRIEEGEAAALRAMPDGVAFVIIGGLTTPAATACTTLRALRRRSPSSAMIIVADYLEYQKIDVQVRRSDNFLLICRPWEPDKIAQQISRAMQSARIQQQVANMRSMSKDGT